MFLLRKYYRQVGYSVSIPAKTMQEKLSWKKIYSSYNQRDILCFEQDGTWREHYEKHVDWFFFPMSWYITRTEVLIHLIIRQRSVNSRRQPRSVFLLETLESESFISISMVRRCVAGFSIEPTINAKFRNWRRLGLRKL